MAYYIPIHRAILCRSFCFLLSSWQHNLPRKIQRRTTVVTNTVPVHPRGTMATNTNIPNSYSKKLTTTTSSRPRPISYGRGDRIYRVITIPVLLLLLRLLMRLSVDYGAHFRILTWSNSSSAASSPRAYRCSHLRFPPVLIHHNNRHRSRRHSLSIRFESTSRGLFHTIMTVAAAPCRGRELEKSTGIL